MEAVYFIGAFVLLVALIYGTLNQRKGAGPARSLCAFRRQAAIVQYNSEILHQFARRANHFKILSSLFRKNIPLNPSGKSKVNSRHPVPPEGRRPSSRTLGQVAVDAAASGA